MRSIPIFSNIRKRNNFLEAVEIRIPSSTVPVVVGECVKFDVRPSVSRR